MADRVVGYVLAALALFWGWEALRLPKPPFLGVGAIGPSAYPLLLSGALGLLAVALIWQSYRRARSAEQAPAPFALSTIARHVLPIALVFVGYVMAMGGMGYVLSTLLFTAVLARVQGYPVLASTGAALAVTLLLYALFKWWLGVPLPRGVVGV